MTDERNPIKQIFILVLHSVAALFAFQFLSLVFILSFSDLSYEEFFRGLSNPYAYPEMRWNLILMQGISALGAFVLAPIYFIHKFEYSDFRNYIPTRKLSIIAVSLTVLLTLSFMIVNGIFIEWNLNFQFPEGFHQWASQKEDQLQLLTEYLTVFDNPFYFFISFLVIAVLPAFGEELLFRGLIQKYTEKFSGNIHIAIWATAIFFSAFHMQFFGFIPRMLLGAFFGYLFYFSGNLWYAIIAHFVNNGFTLTLLYLYQKGVITYDIDSTESVPLNTAIIFFVIGTVLLILFYKQFQNSDNLPQNGEVKREDG